MHMMVSNKEKVNSLLAAVFITETNLCAIIGYFFSINNISVMLMLLLIVISALYNKAFALPVNKCLLLFFIITVFVISFLRVQPSYVTNYFFHFVVFGITAFLLTSNRLHHETVMDYMIPIYFVHVILYYFLSRGNVSITSSYWGQQMGLAYSFVPMALIAVAQLRRKNTGNKIIIGMAFITLLLSVVALLFDFSTRGALVSLVLGVFMLSMQSIKQKNKIRIALLVFGCGVVLYWNIENILGPLTAWASEHNVLALKKFLRMYETGDYTNGRNELYANAYTFIKQNPIVGNGIGFFELKNGGLYVHQVFLQVFCEFGVLGFFLYILFLAKCMLDYISDKAEKCSSLMVVLFVVTFFPLIFSNAYWLLPTFWFHLFYKISEWSRSKGGDFYTKTTE